MLVNGANETVKIPVFDAHDTPVRPLFWNGGVERIAHRRALVSYRTSP